MAAIAAAGSGTGGPPGPLEGDFDFIVSTTPTSPPAGDDVNFTV
jgi:hypothetical protein